MACLILEGADALHQGHAGLQQQRELFQRQDVVLRGDPAPETRQAHLESLWLARCQGDNQQPLGLKSALRIPFMEGLNPARKHAPGAIDGFVLK